MYNHPDPRANATSWLLASEIARRTDTLTLRETHPGGGMYDCLSFCDDSGPVIDINRAGSIHVRQTSLDRYADWPSLDRANGIKPAAVDILTAAGLPAPKRALPTTRTTLTHRVIAELLTSKEPDLDARSALHDSSGPDGTYVEPDAFGDDPRLRIAPPEHIWLIKQQKQIVARLWDGWAFTSAGEHLDLYRRYRRGVSVHDLAFDITS